MPIYAYRCDSCGFEKDHLQKLDDPILRICPQCAQATYTKLVTAAGFQLKGNGWYATDFKDKAGKAPAGKEPTEPPPQSAPQDAATKAAPPPAACTTGAEACADS